MKNIKDLVEHLCSQLDKFDKGEITEKELKTSNKEARQILKSVNAELKDNARKGQGNKKIDFLES